MKPSSAASSRGASRANASSKHKPRTQNPSTCTTALKPLVLVDRLAQPDSQSSLGTQKPRRSVLRVISMNTAHAKQSIKKSMTTEAKAAEATDAEYVFVDSPRPRKASSLVVSPQDSPCPAPSAKAKSIPPARPLLKSAFQQENVSPGKPGSLVRPHRHYSCSTPNLASSKNAPGVKPKLKLQPHPLAKSRLRSESSSVTRRPPVNIAPKKKKEVVIQTQAPTTTVDRGVQTEAPESSSSVGCQTTDQSVQWQPGVLFSISQDEVVAAKSSKSAIDLKKLIINMGVLDHIEGASDDKDRLLDLSMHVSDELGQILAQRTASDTGNGVVERVPLGARDRNVGKPSQEVKRMKIVVPPVDSSIEPSRDPKIRSELLDLRAQARVSWVMS
ncbi:unnamed protein product [Mycena citricolor]|uniref:Uncharacterized protein n=1 Tax=Mycena citricolor TaxID=2018698 RepID=A0AAD2HP65_9AGAR|nr:unnamed protein product [Mycena citricolor]